MTGDKAAGGVLTGKQAPHRPGTAPALALLTKNRGFGTILNNG